MFNWPWKNGPLGPPAPGSTVLPFSLAIAIGTATSLAAYLTLIFAMKLKLLDAAVSSGPAAQTDLATRLLKCLVIHGTCNPQDSVEELVMSSLKTKIQASSRTRPTPLQMHAMLSKLVELRLEARGRVPRATVFREVLNQHNIDASAKTRIPAEEICTVLLLDAAGPAFQELVALAWQAEAPQYSALPVSMLNQTFLSPETALPVPLSCSRILCSYVLGQTLQLLNVNYLLFFFETS